METHCSSDFFPDTLLLKLQRVQNASAQLLTRSGCRDWILHNSFILEKFPTVSSTGVYRENTPILSHFTLNLLMQNATFTFIMPTKFIPGVMPMTFHNNSSNISCKAMPKTDPSIQFRPWKSIICIYQYLQNKLQFRKYPKNTFYMPPRFWVFLSRCLCRAGCPWHIHNNSTMCIMYLNQNSAGYDSQCNQCKHQTVLGGLCYWTYTPSLSRQNTIQTKSSHSTAWIMKSSSLQEMYIYM